MTFNTSRFYKIVNGKGIINFSHKEASKDTRQFYKSKIILYVKKYVNFPFSISTYISSSESTVHLITSNYDQEVVKVFARKEDYQKEISINHMLKGANIPDIQKSEAKNNLISWKKMEPCMSISPKEYAMFISKLHAIGLHSLSCAFPINHKTKYSFPKNQYIHLSNTLEKFSLNKFISFSLNDHKLSNYLREKDNLFRIDLGSCSLNSIHWMDLFSGIDLFNREQIRAYCSDNYLETYNRNLKNELKRLGMPVHLFTVNRFSDFTAVIDSLAKDFGFSSFRKFWERGGDT